MMQTLPAAEGFPYGTAGSACYLCHGAPQVTDGDTVIIDLGQNIEMEGWLRICEGCAKAIAELLGCASESETKRLRGRIRNLEDQIVQVEMELQGVGERVRAAI